MGSKFRAAALLLLLAGLGVLLYPAVSSWINRCSGSYAIQEWETQVEQLENEELTRQLALAEAYNDALGSGEEPENYGAILDLGSGMIGHIRIPSIKVDLPIYHGVEEDALSKGAGHLPESAFPLGRAGDHPVITGHTGLPSARLFTDLIRLQEGDLFYLRVLDRELCYQVDSIRVVLPSEREALRPVPGEDLCTLVTCTPYGVNSHRLLVRGRRVPLPTAPAMAQTAGTAAFGTRLLWLLPLAAAAALPAKHLLDGRGKPAYNGKYLKKKKER